MRFVEERVRADRGLDVDADDARDAAAQPRQAAAVGRFIARGIAGSGAEIEHGPRGLEDGVDPPVELDGAVEAAVPSDGGLGVACSQHLAALHLHWPPLSSAGDEAGW